MSREPLCDSCFPNDRVSFGDGECRGKGQAPPANAKVPTIDQSLEMYGVGSPKISPDGRRVVYEQTRTNWDANAFETDLWIADVATGERRQLTTAGHSCNRRSGRRTGSGSRLCRTGRDRCRSRRRTKRQLWVMPADGGEAQQLTKMEKGVGGFEWAPDSQRIAFSAEAPEPKPMKDRKDTFGEYHVIHADYEMEHLWLVDLPKTDAAGRVSAVRRTEGADEGKTRSAWRSFRFRRMGRGLHSARRGIPI